MTFHWCAQIGLLGRGKVQTLGPRRGNGSILQYKLPVLGRGKGKISSVGIFVYACKYQVQILPISISSIEFQQHTPNFYRHTFIDMYSMYLVAFMNDVRHTFFVAEVVDIIIKT